MLVFDTNVLSELVRPVPDAAAAAWVVEQAASRLYLTAVSEGELRYGLAIMPPGKRRDRLAQGLKRMLCAMRLSLGPTRRRWSRWHPQ